MLAELTTVPLAIRPIGRSDAERVARGFAALSRLSRYYRYGRETITQAEALGWLSALDGVDHFALGGCHAELAEPLGVARYVRCPDDPLEAEIAVTVVDAWHGRGIGGRLTRALLDHARSCGIETVRASILLENRAAVRLMKSIGGRRISGDFGTIEMQAAVGSSGAGTLAPLRSSPPTQ
jgi:RimJ/RimL family protein N-acetyltransferase